MPLKSTQQGRSSTRLSTFSVSIYQPPLSPLQSGSHSPSLESAVDDPRRCWCCGGLFVRSAIRLSSHERCKSIPPCLVRFRVLLWLCSQGNESRAIPLRRFMQVTEQHDLLFVFKELAYFFQKPDQLEDTVEGISMRSGSSVISYVMRKASRTAQLGSRHANFHTFSPQESQK